MVNAQSAWFTDLSDRAIQGVKFQIGDSWFALGYSTYISPGVADPVGTLYLRGSVSASKKIG